MPRVEKERVSTQLCVIRGEKMSLSGLRYEAIFGAQSPRLTRKVVGPSSTDAYLQFDEMDAAIRWRVSAYCQTEFAKLTSNLKVTLSTLGTGFAT